MAKESKRKSSDDSALDMTPMIDVVFQLIIFFVVTLKQEDKLAYLDALAPQGNSAPSAPTEITQTKIMVFAGENAAADAKNPQDLPPHGILNCMLEGDASTRRKGTFESALRAVAKNDPEAPVIITCMRDSKHKTLVYVLETCTRFGLKNLSIMTI